MQLLIDESTLKLVASSFHNNLIKHKTMITKTGNLYFYIDSLIIF